ncbi:MAG: hypothetical protein M1290_07040 [Candidatus Thermoplasmatota archaeon]|jgi:hypothetical protein|nr:hypothetical protein [Candidatus Thermoplasmatota archaeon]MCL5790197.1 hypothetical protein [Candidatus Thermoplasmatota archaeon]
MISIYCPFEDATYTYTLVYLFREQGTIVTTLNYEDKQRENELDEIDVSILRAFKYPTTGKHFKAEIEMSISLNMDKDKISVQ